MKSKTQIAPHRQLPTSVATAVALVLAAQAPLAFADPDPDPAPDDGSPSEIVVTGTRQSGMAAAESPAPIQVLGAESLRRVGAPGSPAVMHALIVAVGTLGAALVP